MGSDIRIHNITCLLHGNIHDLREIEILFLEGSEFKKLPNIIRRRAISVVGNGMKRQLHLALLTQQDRSRGNEDPGNRGHCDFFQAPSIKK